MPWTENDYPDSMKNLDVSVRVKAVEIANRLVEEDYEEGRAISIAIAQAREWYEKRGGDVSTDISHHLIPYEAGWALKPIDGNISDTFDTKEEAMKKIKEMSSNQAIKVMVHDSNGKFQKVY